MMPEQTTPKAGRQKIRCPKCTAFFKDPAKSVFECPICSCRLSANGANALTESLPTPIKVGEFGQGRAVNGNDELSRAQSLKESSSDGNDRMLDKGASPPEIHRREEQQPFTDTEKEFPHVFENDNKGGQPSVDGTGEGFCRNDGMLGPHCANEVDALVGRSIDTTGKLSSGNAAKEDSSLLRKEDNLTVAEDQGIDGQDCVEKDGAGDRRLQSQRFRTTRCEFSFKYSLGGDSPLKSDDQSLRRKSFASSRIVSSETTTPNAQASDMPLSTPLRVRISNSHEESSDPSEHERYSFNSETDSGDGSDSDFDFPAPWAEGQHDTALPVSFVQNEIFHSNSDCVVSAAPHQLELQDVYDPIDHEEFTLQESSEHLKGAKMDFPSQVEDVSEFMSDAGRESKFRGEVGNSMLGSLQPILDNGKDEVVSVAPNNAESAIMASRSLDHPSQVINLASHVSSVMLNQDLDEVDPNGMLLMEDGTQKLHAEFSASVQQEVPEAITTSATSSNQEDLKPKLSASSLSHIDCSDGAHSISSTGHLGPGFQMVDSPDSDQNVLDHSHVRHGLSLAREGQLADSLLSNMSKIEKSYDGPNARNANTSNRHASSRMKNTELELDLYSHNRFPHEVVGEGKSSYTDLWAEKDSAVTALSDATLVNAPKGRMYYERNDPLKLVEGNFHVKAESQPTRSDDGEDLYMPGSDRNLRGPAASQGKFFQPTSEHVDWRGNITAVENQGHHADLHEMNRNPGSYSQFPVNNSPGFAVANSQPYVLTNHHYVPDHLGFGTSSTNQMYAYPLPSQSLVLPAAFQNHALTHVGYHAMSPACVVCSYHQHPHMQPQHIPHCAVCYNQSGSAAYTSGHAEHWNCYQAHQGLMPTCASSLVEDSQACTFSTNLAQRQDFSNAELMSQASLARRVNQCPPLPKKGAAPYFTCKGCSRVLQVPSDLPPTDGITQKLRCGACRKVTKFSVNHYSQQRHVVSHLFSPELDSMGGAPNTLPLIEYNTHSRQVPVSTAIESIKSSYDHNMSKVNPGPCEQNLNRVWPQVNSTTATIFIPRNSEQNPQGGEFFRGQPRNHAIDSSLNMGPSHLEHASNLTDVMSPRKEVLRSTESFGFERSKVNPAASFHLTVDEKEEGLDFGAPRISDGDSLDHSERSPENVQHSAAAKPGSPLLVLLNQESTRFRLTLEPRVPLEESRSSACSPASDSFLNDNSVHDRPRGRERDMSQSHSTSAQHFVSKGPKYIAGLLRRSLRDFGKGGQ